MSETNENTENITKSINFEISRNLYTWLNFYNCSIISTSYKTNLVFCFSRNSDKINVWYSNFSRPMELFVSKNQNNLGDTIHLGTQLGIISFINNNNEKINKDIQNNVIYDKNFVGKRFNIIGDLDIHDVYELDGSIYFASSLLNSICVISPNTTNTTNNFDIFWTPSFITYKNDTPKKNNKIPNEDRCHLNSFCIVDGKVKYATTVSDTDVEGGWRDNRVGGGIILDIETDEIVCSNLCMPHSLNYYKNKLYVLDSGTGRFGYVDFNEPNLDNRFKEIAFIPGFLRGLKFIDTYAVIGMSMDRHEKLFSGLPLNDIMKNKKINPRCGIKIVNIVTGDIEHSIELINVMEIYGIGIVENSKTTRLLDLTTDSLINAYKY
ncbi:MAG: TIGR03032 family protein [Homavirus sp.]|uniref:TIGR03032 family protein n=1 Tax=Homavirus sp. TaxID=2487769 RepID=A0A3G5A4S3_9VIRU|nr:MAG: TIGR03032 family protein [Homavirus sp.]